MSSISNIQIPSEINVITAPQVPSSPPKAPINVPRSLARGSFGFSAGDLVGLNNATLEARLKDFNSLGIKWVRLDIPWSVVQQKNSSTYDWSSYDSVIDTINRYGLKTLAILDYTPEWARPTDCTDSHCQPADSQQFAEYAGKTVEHFKSKNIKYWEIWNEPNHIAFWKPLPNVQAYTKLLIDTSKAIRSKDSQAIIVTGGLAPALTQVSEIGPRDFLQGIYDNGGRNYFDAVGDHAYSFPALPGTGENWSGWTQMTNLRTVLSANGDSNKEIWVTEYGAPTNGSGSIATSNNLNFSGNPDHVDETLQALMAKQAIQIYRSTTGLGPFFWYHYKDAGTDSSSSENFFGLIRHDGSKKPAYQALKDAIASGL